MAALALGSYVLVKQVPGLSSSETKLTPALVPDVDYRLSSFTMEDFDKEGNPTQLLAGQEMRHKPAQDLLEIDGMSMQIRDSQKIGPVSFQADRAQIIDKAHSTSH